MRSTFIIVSIACLAAASGQAAAKEGGLVFESGLAIEPAISGKSLFDLDRDRSDGGEYSMYAQVSTGPVILDQPFYAKMGSSYSPQLFQKRPAGVDQDDPTSSSYIELGFGNKWHSFGAARRATCRTFAAYKPARLRPYASYRHSRTASGFFGSPLGHSNMVTAGLRIADLAKCANPQSGGSAELQKYLNYDLRAEVSRDWTSDPQEENTTWTARSDFQTMDYFGTDKFDGVHLLARARGDRIVFANARPSGAMRRDWRWRLGGGVGMTLPSAVGGPDFEVEVRHEWRRSDEAGQDKNSTQVSASLSWTL